MIDDLERYRRELQAHCYRMLGSIQEAEDAVQEILLRAWRGQNNLGATERAALRSWLYRIATNVCLTMLARRRSRRRLTPQLANDSTTQLPEGALPGERLWLEPYPETLLEALPDSSPGPQARYEMREATRLAFVAAIQLLPPRQRATLLLRDVLGWSASEAAGTLDASVPAVNSALQRARLTLAKGAPLPEALTVSEPDQSRLLDRYVQTWERMDLDGFVALLKEDAVFAMPPFPQWYQGRTIIHDFLAWAWRETGYVSLRLIACRANGQPGFALYGRTKNDVLWRAHALHILTLHNYGDSVRIAELTSFMDEKALFPRFDLPLELPV